MNKPDSYRALLTLIALLVLAGCTEAHPTNDNLTFDDCTPTDLYVQESNPRGLRRVYDCGEASSE